MSGDITEKHVWSTKQLILVVGVAISVTFTLSMIWSRFLYQEQEQKNMKAYVEEQFEILSSRLENKDSRAKKVREALWEVMQTKVDK